MNKIFVKNFRIKLAFFLIMAALIPIISLETISLYDGLRYQRHLLENFEKNDLNSQVRLFDYWLAHKTQEMTVMTLYFEEHYALNNDPLVLENILDILILQDSDIINTFYTSTEGLNIISGGQKGVVDGRNRKWYKNAMSSDIAISTPYKDVLTDKQVITFSGVIKENDEIKGVLGADIIFDQMMVQFFKPFDHHSTELLVFNQADEVVYTSNERLLPKAIMYRDFENNYNSLFAKEYVLKKHIPSLDIQVMLIFNRQQLLSNIDNRGMFMNTLEILLLTTLIVIILAFWIAKILNKPIQSLENKVQAIVEGQGIEDAYSGYEDLDEIILIFEELQKTIHQNTKSISTMRKELDEQNLTLTSLNAEYEKAYDELERFSNELSQKEGEYEDLVDNIVDLIWTIDHEGKLIYANDRLLEILGFSEQDFIGLDLDVIVPSLKSSNKDRSYELLYSRDYDAIDITFIDKNNEKHILTSTSTTRIFQNKQLVSVQGVSRDVTLEKKMYNELNVKNRDLMLINKIGKEMTMTDELPSILNLILDNVESLLEIKVATIRFLNAEDQLIVRALKGEEKELLWSKENVDLKHSHIGYVIHQCQPLILNTLEDIKVESDNPTITTLTAGYKVAILPLSNGDTTFGALSLIAMDTIDDRIVEVLLAFANSTSVALDRALVFEKLQRNYFKTIETLVTAMEAKNHLMQGHSHKVSQLSEYIGEKLYLSQREVKDLYIAALLHDVGKIGLRDAVLRQDFKTSLISIKEEITAKHIEIGKKILEPIGLKKSILEGVYYHHKHFDQTGYPKETLNEVPLFALIIEIADDIDIMMKRNQEYTLDLDDMKTVLIKGSGTVYSPEIVNLVIGLIESKDERLLNIINGGA